MRYRKCPSIVLLLTLTTASCSNPLELEDLLPFDPPEVYQMWWAELERCAGLNGEFEHIRWFTAETVTFDGRDTFGVWSPPSTIYLERFYTTSVTAVKHEMLHELTNGALPHSHPLFTTCTVPSAIVPESEWRPLLP